MQNLETWKLPERRQDLPFSTVDQMQVFEEEVSLLQACGQPVR
jgi:hypothetical protein